MRGPHASSIKTGTTEFYQDYIRPLVIDTIARFHPLQIKRYGKQSVARHISYQ